MTRPFSPLRLSLLGSLVFLFLHCKEDLSVDNSDKNFPITLHYTLKNDAIEFDWEPAKVSTFESYVLVRSNSPIPPGLSPIFGSTENIFTTDRPDSTSFTDISLPLFQEVHYKLYIDIGERFVESDDIAISFDNFLVNGSPAIVRFVTDSNWVVIGDDVNQRVLVLDYNHKTTLGNRSALPFTSVDNMAVTIGNYNNAPALHWWSGYNSPLVMSLPGLVTQQTYGISTAPFSWVVAPDGRFYSTQYDFDNGFTTRKSDDFSIVKGYYRPNYYEHRTLLLLNPAEGLFVEASPYLLRTFKVNSSDGIASDVLQLGTNSYSTFPQYIPASRDLHYFVPQFDGIIYDRNLALVTQIPLASSSGFVDCAFSQDGQYLYVLSNNFQVFGTIITKYNFPSMTVADERRVAGVQPRDIETTNDGGAVFVGSNVNGANVMLIKKINF